MSTPNNLTNSAVSASGEVSTLLVEKYTGKLYAAFTKGENIMSFFDLQEVVGTNMISNKYFGETEVQVLAAGQSVEATGLEFDKNALVVDTQLIARNTVAHLHDVQNDIEGLKSKIAENQAKKLLQVEDYMLIQQLIFGGMNNFESRDDGADGGRTKPRVKGHGYSVHLLIDKATSDMSPNYVMAAVEAAIEKQVEQEVDINDLIICMPYRYFNILRDAERIINQTYKTADDTTIEGFVLKSYNLPVLASNRFPTKNQVLDNANGIHHKLSNDNNNFRYDVTEGMQDTVAVIFNTDALLVGRSIALQGEIFRNPENKTWYIDAFMSEGAIPDRWESVSVVSAVVVGDALDHESILARAKRKSIITSSDAAMLGASTQLRSEKVDSAEMASLVANAVVVAMQAIDSAKEEKEKSALLKKERMAKAKAKAV